MFLTSRHELFARAPLAVVDQGGRLKIHPRDIEQCHDLGQNVAFSLRSD